MTGCAEEILMTDCDPRFLLDWTIEGLTILEVMRRMKTAEGRRSLSTKQQTLAEAIRLRDGFLYSLIKTELQNERNEKEK